MSRTAGIVGQHNLPEDLTSLIGREPDRIQIGGLMAAHRVVSLVGVGGVGKTRLALAVARTAVLDFPDGIWLVELGSLIDGRLLSGIVAASIGLASSPRRPVIETLIAAFGSSRVLLVLDNCEHLVQACAELVERLVRSCSHLQILVTSREPLGVPGEVVCQVAPLATPNETVLSVEQLLEIDSIRLFVERVQAALPGFSLSEANAAVVAQVCRGLDGLPLALELAAAAVKVLSPHQLAARLDDRFKLLVRGSRTAPVRHQTLESAVAWSYDLLDPDDRHLFDLLSVFTGSFSLDAVEEVCGFDPRSPLDSLARLVDQSLVLTTSDDAGDRRYSLLETLRAYGRERLRERGEHALLHKQFTLWVLGRAEEAGAALRGPDQAPWLRWAEREHDNIRLALEWAIASGDADTALRLVSALWWSWLLHDRWAEAHEWLERALSMPEAAPRTLVRGRALQGAGATAGLRGQYALAQAHIDECLAIARDLDDETLLLAGHSAQALLFQQQGMSEDAQPHVQAMVDLARQLGRPWYEARAAEFVASRALRTGDLSAAAAELEHALRLARAAGDSWNIAMLLGQLGDVERMRGTHPRAAPLYQESIRLFQELGLREDPSRVHNLGYVALAEGRIARAAELFTQALRLFRRAGDQRGIADCMIGLGCVRAGERRPAEAARLFGAAAEALEALGSAVWPSNRADYQHWERIARAAMGTHAWDDVWTSGRAHGIETIVNEVLSTEWMGAPPVNPRAISSVDELTPRELQVAQLAARGLSNRRIGDTLVIAEKTAANHLQNALDKLDVHSRSELAARAVELGLAPAQN
ncbi:MAG: LuxR family transcriptional regulator [Chloroflexi bacterium]|nr:MAG: LuxR family transcriptional regulator [Chloroflexota bacterium]